MKIIDLLNKIANKEELPTYIFIPRNTYETLSVWNYKIYLLDDNEIGKSLFNLYVDNLDNPIHSFFGSLFNSTMDWLNYEIEVGE